MIGPSIVLPPTASSTAPDCTRNCCCRSTMHYLKGKETDYRDRPAVEYFVRGADAVRSGADMAAAQTCAISPGISRQGTSGSVARSTTAR